MIPGFNESIVTIAILETPQHKVYTVIHVLQGKFVGNY